VEWAEKEFVSQEKRLVPAYHKKNVLGLQKFLRDKLPTWENNGSCVGDTWKNFKDIVLRVSNVLFGIKFWNHIRIQNTKRK
jgi:hypothetical protein